MGRPRTVAKLGTLRPARELGSLSQTRDKSDESRPCPLGRAAHSHCCLDRPLCRLKAAAVMSICTQMRTLTQATTMTRECSPQARAV